MPNYGRFSTTKRRPLRFAASDAKADAGARQLALEHPQGSRRKPPSTRTHERIAGSAPHVRRFTKHECRSGAALKAAATCAPDERVFGSRDATTVGLLYCRLPVLMEQTRLQCCLPASCFLLDTSMAKKPQGTCSPLAVWNLSKTVGKKEQSPCPRHRKSLC